MAEWLEVRVGERPFAEVRRFGLDDSSPFVRRVHSRAHRSGQHLMISLIVQNFWRNSRGNEARGPFKTLLRYLRMAVVRNGARGAEAGTREHFPDLRELVAFVEQ